MGDSHVFDTRTLDVGDTFEATDVSGHLRTYTVVGWHHDGSPRSHGWNAPHSDNCRCITDPESWY